MYFWNKLHVLTYRDPDREEVSGVDGRFSNDARLRELGPYVCCSILINYMYLLTEILTEKRFQELMDGSLTTRDSENWVPMFAARY